MPAAAAAAAAAAATLDPVLFRYRLLDPEGGDLGLFLSTQQEWRPGSHLQRDRDGSLLVTAVIEAEEGATHVGYLVVVRTPTPAA